jgi:nucleoporin NUP82
MPKILSYTPAWLSRPSPGSQAFTSSNNTPSRESSSTPFHGPHRLLAYRGTEIFSVVGNEIRWLDLRKLKNDWEASTDFGARGKDSSSEQQRRAASQNASYRVCCSEFHQAVTFKFVID